jgi:hypothetical protein
MSRSFKKTPVCGITGARSEKRDKRRANRTYRRLCRARLRSTFELPQMREVSNVWSFAKDGKICFDPYYDWRLLCK